MRAWEYKDRCEAVTKRGHRCMNRGEHIEQWRDGGVWLACSLHSRNYPDDIFAPGLPEYPERKP